MSKTQLTKKEFNHVYKALTDTDNMGDFSLREPDEIEIFLQKIQLQPTILRYARMEALNSRRQTISRFYSNDQFLHGVPEGVLLNDSQQTKLAFEPVELQTHRLMGELPITWEAMELN